MMSFFGSVERLHPWEGLVQIHLLLEHSGTTETTVLHMFLVIFGLVT